MHIKYLMLIMLLSIAVPFNGFGAMACGDACAAQAGMDMEMSRARPCCDDADASGQLPDNACASQCSLFGGCAAIQFLAASAASIPVLAAAAPRKPGNMPSPAAPDSFRVWRPPRSL
ncbi:MAG: hypothetical protein ABIK82_06585 [Pseudomonadota bacterium]